MFNLKRSLIPMLATVLTINTTFAQSSRMDLSVKNEPLKQFIKQIETKTDYSFMLDQTVDQSQMITVSASQENLETILKKAFAGKRLVYEIVGKQIILKTLSGNVNPTRRVTGIVTDEKGEPVIGANVIQKGTANGVITDVDGTFSINVPEGALLLISYIGYAPKEVKSGNVLNLKISLQEDSQTLDEVVIVGYGTQKKAYLTGSVEVVGEKELKNRPVANASALLQGRVAGIQFSTPSGGNAPGAAPVMQIRGKAALGDANTEPLVVIDGIPSDMSNFNALNPNDIESVSILKDASASAVYGARAPYGVLIVTTKMGRREEKPSVTYSGNFGLVQPVRMPETTDAYTFALSKNQAKLNSRFPVQFQEDKLDLIWDNIQNPGKYTLADLNPGEGDNWGWGNVSYNNNNWLDIWLKPLSLRQQHDLSLRGGGSKNSYFVSLGYVNQPSVFNYIEDLDNYNRFNMNGGVESDVTDWMKLTYRARYSYEVSKSPGFGGAGRSGIYNWAYGMWPTTTLQWPDGTYVGVVQQSFESGGTTTNQHRLDNVLAADFQIAKGWTAHVDGTWRMNYEDYENINIPLLKTRPSGVQFWEGSSSLSKNNSTTQYWTIQGYSAYEKALGDHFFRIQLGAQAENSRFRKLISSANDLFVSDMPSISIAQGQRTTRDELTEWATAGFFGRFNYNYKERYLLEVNGRYDGSGRYSTGKRWGVFPSGFLGWVLSNERFWRPLKPYVDFAKLKASYGTLGNQGGSAGYLHIPTMNVKDQAGWIINGKRNAWVETPGLINMFRTWEKITTLDLGAEVNTFNNRLSAEFNWFSRKSWDIIGPATPKPAVLGTSAPEVNNAEFVTKGFELQLRWRDNITPQWSYSAGLILSDAMSKITKYNTVTNDLGGWYVGKEIGEMWGYVSNRLLNSSDFKEDGTLKVSQSKISGLWFPGDVKYEDLDGDGKVWSGSNTLEDHGDLKKIGNYSPRYRYGLTLSSDYEFQKAGRLGISIFMEGVMKRDVFISNQYYFWGRGGGNTYDIATYKGEHLDYYRDETSAPRLIEHLGLNKEAYFPRPYDSDEGNKNFQTNTRYKENGAYLRFKNIQLTYSLPTAWLSKARIKNCSLYFSGENLFVISSLPKYLDPEESAGGRMYPQQAVYSFGINIGFN